MPLPGAAEQDQTAEDEGIGGDHPGKAGRREAQRVPICGSATFTTLLSITRMSWVRHKAMTAG